MEILSLEVTATGLCRVVSSEGGAFYIRPEFLKTISKEDFMSRTSFNDAESQEIIDAGLITGCECKAVDYLARSEQCRSKLFKKLLDKGYEGEYINPALDYLESINYLSDARYCRSWLNTRKINHAEGRIKLLAELLGRGISRETANAALDEFFEENNEEEIAAKCCEKLKRKGKTGDKLLAAIIQMGFTYKVAAGLVKKQD